MAEERASKKLWDKGAWKDAGFFLKYLRPHSRVFIPALVALAVTGGMTIVFIKELAAVAGKGIGGATGPPRRRNVRSRRCGWTPSAASSACRWRL